MVSFKDACVPLLFFLSGIGSTVAWTAILSNLVFYTAHLGDASYIYLNLAAYIPLIPIALAQAKWDSKFDQKYDSLNAFYFRGTFSYGVAVAAILLTPQATNNLLYLSALTLILGITSAILQGALKQMATFIYSNGGVLQAAVSFGMQGSVVPILIVVFLTGFGSNGDVAGLYVFNYSILGINVFCWLCFYVLMTMTEDVNKSMMRRDFSIADLLKQQSMDLTVPLALEANEGEVSSLMDTTASNVNELDYYELWKRTRVYSFSLILTLFNSMLVASYLNIVPSSNPANTSFPQVLFYAKMISDVLGRPATIIFEPKSTRIVVVITALRTLFVPVFIIYALTDLLPRNDFLITSGLIIFSFFSGYIVTAVYQLAPDVLSEEEKINTLKQANLLNISFGISIVLGLLVGLFLLDL